MNSSVTAVIVAAEDTGSLSRTVQAVREQHGGPQSIIGVRIGAEEFAPRLSQGMRTLRLSAGTPTSRAYAAGIEAAIDSGAEWIWLLPAGSVPEQGSLEAMWDTAQQSSALGVLSPLHISDDGRDRLFEAGLTTGTAWRRMTGLAPDEIDQGQYMDRSDVLGASLDGMLLSAEAYAAAGGFAHLLGPAYTGLDFCRRARLAGTRVCLVPGARLRRGPEAPVAEAPLRARWSAWLLAARPGTPLLLLLWIQLLGLLRALYRLAAKEPRIAFAELAAAFAQWGRLPALLRLRRSAGRRTRVPRSAVDSLRLGWRATRTTARIEESLDEPVPEESSGLRSSPVNTDNVVASFSPIDALGAPRMRLATRPVVLVTALTLLASAIGQFRLATPGYLVGGALPATDVAWSDLLTASIASWNPAGLGHAAQSDPLLGVLALWALPFLGHVALSIKALWLLAMPLAALAAYAGAGALTSSAWLRAGVALAWAAMPTLLLALDEGRLGTVVAHILLPLAALGVARATGAARAGRSRGRPGSGGVPSYTAAAAGGLAFAGVAAGAPVLLVPGLLAVAVAALAAGRGRRRPLLVFPLAPAAVLLPWLLDSLTRPSLLFGQPGALIPFPAVPAWQLLLLQPQPPAEREWLAGLDPQLLTLLFAPLLAAYALSMLRADARTGVLGWSAGLVLAGLGAALAPLVVAVGADPLIVAAGSPGPGLSLLALGLLVAGTQAAVWAGRRSALSWAGRGLAVLTVVGAAAQLGIWTVEGAVAARPTSAVATSDVPSLSALANDRYAGPQRLRTLVLRQSGTEMLGEVRGPEGGTLLAGSQIVSDGRVDGPFTWRQAAGLDDAEQAVGTAVAALTAGSGTDARPLLAQIGVGTVLLDTESSAGDMAPQDEPLFSSDEASDRLETLSTALDNSQGLSRLGESAAGRMWSVDPAPGAEPAWAVLETETGQRSVLDVAADGSIEVAEGTGSRRVVFAQRSDDGFSGRIAGTVIAPAAGDWRLAFDVPPDGGTLVIAHRETADAVWGAVRVLLLGLAILLALPLPGRRRAAPFGSRAAPASGGAPSTESSAPLETSASTETPASEAETSAPDGAPMSSRIASAEDAAQHGDADDTAPGARVARPGGTAGDDADVRGGGA